MFPVGAQGVGPLQAEVGSGGGPMYQQGGTVVEQRSHTPSAHLGGRLAGCRVHVIGNGPRVTQHMDGVPMGTERRWRKGLDTLLAWYMWVHVGMGQGAQWGTQG